MNHATCRVMIFLEQAPQRLRLSFTTLSGIMVLLVATAAGCSGQPVSTVTGKPQPKQQRTLPASNQAMARWLRNYSRQLDPEKHLYVNDRRLTLLAKKFEEPGAQVSLPTGLTLARELIRAGQPQKALKVFAYIRKVISNQQLSLGADLRCEVDALEAAAWLRLGEQENCLNAHSRDSCLLPIRGGGVHRITEGSQNAARIYTELLQRFPDRLDYKWLLNLASMTLGEYPHGVPTQWRIEESAFRSAGPLKRFYDVAMPAGVADNQLSGGVAIEDFNGDGLLDIVTSSWGVDDQLRYFQNLGNGNFADRTQAALLQGLTGGLNLTHADFDNDGDADLFVLRGAWLGPLGEQPNSLLANQGDGTFIDVTEEAGLLTFQPTQTAAWGDFDNDGWLDLFVGNESRGQQRPCELWRNNGNGTFTNVAKQYRLLHSGFVKAAVWGDYNNDGYVDLYLSQYTQKNILFENRRSHFVDVTDRAKVGEPLNSFPCWFFDYNNDGWLDLLVGSFSGDFDGDSLEQVVADYLKLPGQGTRCRLYQNQGDGTFADVSEIAAVDRVLLAMGANFGDLDNDGWLDAYFGTGEPKLSTLVPNVMLRNNQGRFQDVTSVGGFGSLQKGHGIAFGDLDNDGDQDLYAVLGGAYSGDVYPNMLFDNPGFGNHWVTLFFEGVQSNRRGVGARVKIVTETAGTRREIHRVVGNTGSFGSNSLQLEVGLGKADSIVTIEVFWPVRGQKDIYSSVPMDQMYVAREGAPKLDPLARTTFRWPQRHSEPGHHHHPSGHRSGSSSSPKEGQTTSHHH